MTKSSTSALVGIALGQGYLSSVGQKMLDFFPEIIGQVTDPRKQQITIRHLLQMRAGYPWEETDPVFWDGLVSGHYPPLIEEFPLIASGNRVPLQQSIVQLAGDYRRQGIRHQSQVIR
ncbi:serine hydrolase [Chloroflexota bacterium]